MQQLLLPLNHSDRYVEELVYASANADALSWLRRYPDWPISNVMILGPKKSGKTILAKWFAAQVGALYVDPREPVPLVSEIRQSCVILDDAHLCGQEWLFHLYNAQLAKRAPLLLLSDQDLCLWQVETKDLASRLKTFYPLIIQDPDETMMKMLLMKHFQGRGLRFDVSVIDYLMMRLPRTYEMAHKAAETFDRAVLEGHKSLTLAMAKSFIEDLRRLEEPDLVSVNA